jgi:hypothetical protein
MIFGKHNFTTNFLNAIGYQDEFMADQIIIDEVARLIVDDKKNVVEKLRNAGVNATYRDNNDLIKALLVKEIENENPEILQFLAGKIIQNQVDEDQVKSIAQTANATGTEKKKSKFGENIGKVLQDENVKESLSNVISSGIKKVFSKKNKEKTSNDDQLTERLKVNEMKTNSTKKTNKKTILIVLAISAGAILVGGLVFYFVKRKYDKGGIIDSNVKVTSIPPAQSATGEYSSQ